jgi:hypothetical protein
MNDETHVCRLATTIQKTAATYYGSNPECDVNDVMSALALTLVMMCRGLNVSRTDMLRNVASLYENTETGHLN